MKNYTGLKVAKKYEPMVEEIYKDFDGVWAYAEAGYRFESSDTHSERQDTQKALYRTFKTLVPCDCEECQHIINKRNEKENEAEEVEEVQEVEELEEVEEVEESVYAVEREIEEYHFGENEEYPNESTKRLLFTPLREEMGYSDFTVHKFIEKGIESEDYEVTLAVRYMKDGEMQEDRLKGVKFRYEEQAMSQYFNIDNYSFHATHLGVEVYDKLAEAMIENFNERWGR